jgi:NADPH:quinone reductase-like Zn-dependent oxidoreductase
MSVPAYQTAIIGTESQTLRISSPNCISIPTVKDNDDIVIVKTQAVALNPVDVKTGYSNFCTPNSISGCDFAGTVVAIGKNHEQRFNIGDRVCGVVHGMNPASPSIGAFAEYVCAIGNFLLKIPEDMSFEEAATFGTAIGTIGMALFWSMQLPASPTNPVDENTPQDNGGRYVLVNGGSSASGLMAIQLLRLYVFHIVKKLPFHFRHPNCGNIKQTRRNSHN